MVFGILKKGLFKGKAGILKHIAGGVDMSKVGTLHGAEPRQILQAVIEKKVPAIMSYLSKRKWHVAKVLLTSLGASQLNVQLSPREKPHPINIQVGQPVGISLKYGYGKFIFETRVVGFEPSPESTSGGTIVLAAPDRVEIVQRRSYFRVDVPGSLKVNVLMWHRGCAADNVQVPPENYWQGRLVNISAGGMQVAIDAPQVPEVKKGQFMGLRFTPMPYETPLMFSAQIRSILPTADGKSVCIGLQIVGLEASPEGRQVLQRICNVVEQYYKLQQSSAKQHDMQPATA
jgi:hypothetical protein